MEGPTPFPFATFVAASPTCFAPSRVRACLAVTWPASLCSSAKTNEAAASNERIVSFVFMVFGVGGRDSALRCPRRVQRRKFRPLLRGRGRRSAASQPLIGQLIFARSITDLPSRLSIGCFFPAFASTSNGQY